MYDLQIFSLILCIVFSFSWWCHLKHRSFKFWLSQIYFLFPLVCCAFTVLSKKALPNPRSWRFTWFPLSLIVYICVCAQLLSYAWLFSTPWTVAHKAPLSMEFSRQEFWSGLPFPGTNTETAEKRDGWKPYSHVICLHWLLLRAKVR